MTIAQTVQQAFDHYRAGRLPQAESLYRQVLAQHGLCASMSRQGNCYDNAFIESFWSSLKYELVYHHRRQFPPPMEHDPAEKAQEVQA